MLGRDQRYMTVVVCVVGTGYAWEKSVVGDSGSLCGRHWLCLGEIKGTGV